VDFAIKQYKAWGGHSACDLDHLIDIVHRKIDDKENLQSQVKLEKRQKLRR
jgi:hypothetical protein